MGAKHRSFHGYYVALGATAVVVALRLSFLDRLLDHPSPYLLLILAVVAAAWADGLKTGLFATALTTAVALALFIDRDGWTISEPQERVRLGSYLVISLAISGFFESLHSAQRRYRETVAEAFSRQKQLADVSAHLQIVTDSMDSAVTRCSRDLKYLWVSRTYATWIGRPVEDIVGRSVEEIIGKTAFAQLEPHFRRVLSGEKARYEEVLQIGKLGERFVTGIYTPTFDDEGRPDGWVAVIEDITERKRTEQALHDADRRKDEFLATLAHELRNPLAPISNAVQLWPLVEDKPEEMAELRAIIGRQIQHMTRIVDDLLDVSRITRGKVQLKKQRIDLTNVLSRAVETIAPFMQQQRHRLHVHIPSEPICIEGDAARLTQVFGNILHNAAKYTGNGGEISLDCRRNGASAVVSVRDNGQGIPGHMLTDIFEMFRQVDLTTSRQHEGLGIGLTLVKQIVENHGGRVEAASDGAGRGSEFRVVLPLAAEEAPAAQPLKTPPIAAQAAARGGLAALPRRRVLVVDDARESAETLAAVLRSRGQEVTVALDAASAIEAVLSSRPDLAIVDIAMPGMDGYAVARSLRAHPELTDLTLVALTGYGREEDRQHALDAGFNLHMTKPADIARIEQVIVELPLAPSGFDR